MPKKVRELKRMLTNAGFSGGRAMEATPFGGTL